MSRTRFQSRQWSPKPLDPVTHEDPAYARGWNDALARDPCEPGEPHRYRIECERCGQPGTLRVSVDPQNALRTERVPADHDAPCVGCGDMTRSRDDNGVPRHIDCPAADQIDDDLDAMNPWNFM